MRRARLLGKAVIPNLLGASGFTRIVALGAVRRYPRALDFEHRSNRSKDSI